MRRIIKSITLLAIMAIAESFQAEERPFRICMGRQHEIGCVRYCGLPNRFSERSGRVHRIGTLSGTRDV